MTHQMSLNEEHSIPQNKWSVFFENTLQIHRVPDFKKPNETGQHNVTHDPRFSFDIKYWNNW